MPAVGEAINLQVLLLSIVRLRFGRWGYYRTYVERTNTKLLLVWQDTLVESYLIGRYLRVPISIIQNGLRHDFASFDGTGIFSQLSVLRQLNPRVDHYFVFGEPTVQRFTKHISAHFRVVGSFRLNEYATGRLRPESLPIRKSVSLGLIVSFPNGIEIPGGSIRGNHNPYSVVAGERVTFSDWFTADEIVAKSLSDFSNAKSLDFSIIGKRSSSDPTERDFFTSILGLENVRVISHEKGHGYEACEPFDYLFTVDSTLGYEMLALGHKVGFVSNRFRIAGIDSDEMTFAHPLDVGKDGPIWTSATTTEGISEFIHRFLSLSDVEWQSIRTTLVPRLMALDPGNTKVRGYIDQVLAGSR
jgi:surface carbohydrate biosynthesis protein